MYSSDSLSNSNKKKEITDISIKANAYLTEDEKKLKLSLGSKLHTFSRAGIIEGVIKAIQDGAPVDYKANGYTALTYATYYGHVNVVRWLIEEAGSDVNHIVMVQETTPLGVAITQGRFEAACLLIEMGALINVKDKDGKSLFYHAVKHGDIRIIKALFERARKTVDINEVDDDLNTLIHHANKTSIEIIDYLVSIGLDINAKNKLGRTILHMAISLNQLHLVQGLCKYNSLLNVQDKNGMTPLHYGVLFQKIQIVETLIDCNPNFELLEFSTKKNPYHYSLTKPSIEISALLRPYYEEANPEDINMTPIPSAPRIRKKSESTPKEPKPPKEKSVKEKKAKEKVKEKKPSKEKKSKSKSKSSKKSSSSKKGKTSMEEFEKFMQRNKITSDSEDEEAYLELHKLKSIHENRRKRNSKDNNIDYNETDDENDKEKVGEDENIKIKKSKSKSKSKSKKSDSIEEEEEVEDDERLKSKSKSKSKSKLPVSSDDEEEEEKEVEEEENPKTKKLSSNSRSKSKSKIQMEEEEDKEKLVPMEVEDEKLKTKSKSKSKSIPTEEEEEEKLKDDKEEEEEEENENVYIKKKSKIMNKSKSKKSVSTDEEMEETDNENSKENRKSDSEILDLSDIYKPSKRRSRTKPKVVPKKIEKLVDDNIEQEMKDISDKEKVEFKYSKDDEKEEFKHNRDDEKEEFKYNRDDEKEEFKYDNDKEKEEFKYPKDDEKEEFKYNNDKEKEELNLRNIDKEPLLNNNKEDDEKEEFKYGKDNEKEEFKYDKEKEEFKHDDKDNEKEEFKYDKENEEFIPKNIDKETTIINKEEFKLKENEVLGDFEKEPIVTNKEDIESNKENLTVPNDKEINKEDIESNKENPTVPNDKEINQEGINRSNKESPIIEKSEAESSVKEKKDESEKENEKELGVKKPTPSKLCGSDLEFSEDEKSKRISTHSKLEQQQHQKQDKQEQQEQKEQQEQQEQKQQEHKQQEQQKNGPSIINNQSVNNSKSTKKSNTELPTIVSTEQNQIQIPETIIEISPILLPQQPQKNNDKNTKPPHPYSTAKKTPSKSRPVSSSAVKPTTNTQSQSSPIEPIKTPITRRNAILFEQATQEILKIPTPPPKPSKILSKSSSKSSTPVLVSQTSTTTTTTTKTTPTKNNEVIKTPVKVKMETNESDNDSINLTPSTMSKKTPTKKVISTPKSQSINNQKIGDISTIKKKPLVKKEPTFLDDDTPTSYPKKKSISTPLSSKISQNTKISTPSSVISAKIMSTLNAIICTVGALKCLFLENNNWTTDPFQGMTPTSLFCLRYVLGYFIYDTVFILYYRNLLDFGTLTHHLLAISLYYLGIDSKLCHFVLISFLFTEITTPFVNLRWFLYSTNKKDHKAYIINGICLAFGFLLFRVVYVSLSVGSALFSKYHLSLVLPLHIWWGTYLGYIIINGLNLFWTILIWKGLIKVAISIYTQGNNLNDLHHKYNNLFHSVQTGFEKSWCWFGNPKISYFTSTTKLVSTTGSNNNSKCYNFNRIQFYSNSTSTTTNRIRAELELQQQQKPSYHENIPNQQQQQNKQEQSSSTPPEPIKLRGDEVARRYTEQIKQLNHSFIKQTGITPHLVVIYIGDNKQIESYIKMKGKACENVGFKFTLDKYSSNIPQDQIIKKINYHNSDPSVHGIVVQLPLPSNLNTQAILESINPTKDVDGLNSLHLGQLFIGKKPLFLPCTPLGIVQLIRAYNIKLEGKHVVVLGRSTLVGRTIATLLSQRDLKNPSVLGGASVTLLHRYSQDIEKYLKTADIIISATGVPGLIKKENIKDKAILIDVGISHKEDESKKSGYRLVGDIDPDAYSKSLAFTTVPGGIGPMTVAMLLNNVLTAAKFSHTISQKSKQQQQSQLHQQQQQQQQQQQLKQQKTEQHSLPKGDKGKKPKKQKK
eukprot:gene5124-6379_t